MKTLILIGLLFLTVACGREAVDPNDPNRDGGEVYLFYSQGHCGVYGLMRVGDELQAFSDGNYVCSTQVDTIQPGETKTVNGHTFQVDLFKQYVRVRVIY